MTLPPVSAETVFSRVNGQDEPALVTVAVSLHNYARYIRACLDSVAAQRHAALDLIVVDDASDEDDSLAVARDWLATHAGRFGRVLLLRHARNHGLAQARNTAFLHARGEFVFVLDADNLLYPRAIGRLRAVLETEPFDAAYSQLECFGAHTGIGTADLWRRENLARRNYVDAMALVSKRAWREVGGYTHIEGGWEDYDFWCKFIDHGLAAAYVPEILCRYRVHERSMLRTETRAQDQDVRIRLTLRHGWLEL
jgi:glycosyltransferase involved in cell wall biosynthesis